MKVHRITVRDVKGVSACTVDFPDSGVVVLQGPNEVGKSTLLEAFDRLLDRRYKATSTAREIKRLQPIGRDVGPYVEAEFTVGGQRVRYAKRWLRQPMTTLQVISPVQEQLAGEAAQARLDRLVEDNLDRTLWDALRLAQAGDGSVAPLVDSAALGAALDAAAGSRLHTDDGEQVLAAVEKEYLACFTPTGRPTGEYRRAMADCTQAQHEVMEAHRRLVEANELLERQESARAQAMLTQTALDEAQQARSVAEEARARMQVLLTAHERAQARLAAVRERARTITRDARQRREQAAALRRLADEVVSVEEQRGKDATALRKLTEALTHADQTVTTAAAELECAETVAELASDDAEHLAELAEAERLGQLAERVSDLMGRLAGARGGLPDRPVGREVLRRARELQHRVDVMGAHHEAASARVRVESLGAEVELTHAATGGAPAVLSRGAVHEDAITQELVVTVPGSVRVVLQPEADGRARQEELGRLRAELAGQLAEAGVADLEGLSDVVEAEEAAQQAVRDLTRDLESALRDRAPAEHAEALEGRLPGGLTSDLAALRDRIAAQRAGRDEDRQLPPDVETARAVARAAQQDVRRCRDANRQALVALQEQQRSAADLRTRLDRAEGRLASLRQQVATATTELSAARSMMSDEALDEELRRRQTALAEAEAEEAMARQALAATDVEGVTARLAAARQVLGEADQAHERATTLLHTLSGQVEMAQSEGRREAYELALAALDDHERRLASLDRRARAARHLWRTLTEHRDRAHATYALPYTRALEDLGRRVYGDGFTVTVDDKLVIRARTLNGTTVPFEDLSGGAKEQLGILARLAIARLVDPAQGVPVVIDDALGYTDPKRLRQMAAVLGAGSRDGADVQVILLTCSPERYAAVPDAATVQLTA